MKMQTFEEWLNANFLPEDRRMVTPEMAYNAALAAANGRIRELEQINSSLVDKANSYIVESGKLANQLTAEREISDKLFLEGTAIINALIAKSDCSVDRNEEFYMAAQWKAEVAAMRAIPITTNPEGEH